MPNFGTQKRKVYHKMGRKTSISTHFSRLWYSFGTRIAICGTPFSGCTTSETIIFLTLNESFLDMASVPTIRVIFDSRRTATAVKKASVEIEVYYNRERTRVSTGVSVLKHIRLKRQTYETYLHIITSHLVSVKIC